MKRLNKRGFTLIELLSVIVVLGIVMVVTTTVIVEAVKAARQKAYDDALVIIAKYVNEEYMKCLMDPTDTEEYNSELFDTECELQNLVASDVILAETKFSDDIESVTMEKNDNADEYYVLWAPVTNGGQFNGVEAKEFKPSSGGVIHIGGPGSTR